MAFISIDDGMAEHEKIEALSDKDFRAHFRAMCWSARRATDGHIPAHMLGALRMSTAQAARLAAGGVWDENGDGWVIHDWLDFNPPSDPVERERWMAARRQRRRRHAERDGNRDT